ncbi:hypothetical protein AAU61_05460 [Desulfocarbo indianensis]|nr:hypothetical protein AAU61_05460 [Desulfocarbo indianensis]
MGGMAGILDLRQRATVPHETLRPLGGSLPGRGLLEKPRRPAREPILAKGVISRLKRTVSGLRTFL